MLTDNCSRLSGVELDGLKVETEFDTSGMISRSRAVLLRRGRPKKLKHPDIRKSFSLCPFRLNAKLQEEKDRRTSLQKTTTREGLINLPVIKLVIDSADYEMLQINYII
jgi:hypothetical protein